MKKSLKNMIEKLHLSALDTYNMICNMKVMYIFEDIGSSVSTLKKKTEDKNFLSSLS